MRPGMPRTPQVPRDLDPLPRPPLHQHPQFYPWNHGHPATGEPKVTEQGTTRVLHFSMVDGGSGTRGWVAFKLNKGGQVTPAGS